MKNHDHEKDQTWPNVTSHDTNIFDMSSSNLTYYEEKRTLHSWRHEFSLRRERCHGSVSRGFWNDRVCFFFQFVDVDLQALHCSRHVLTRIATCLKAGFLTYLWVSNYKAELAHVFRSGNGEMFWNALLMRGLFRVRNLIWAHCKF